MMLARLGQFLMTRFPEKLEVNRQHWDHLKEDVQSYKGRLEGLETNMEAVLKRLSTVETSAVHKDAVKDLVMAVKAYKDELAAMKVGLGLNRIGDSEIRAMLNGVPIPDSSEENPNV